MTACNAAYDVAIAGAGAAGSICAALLAREGLRVALLDPQQERRFTIGECLPDSGASNLRQLGLPCPADGGPHRRIRGVHSRWGGDTIVQDAMTSPGGGGWRLDRVRFEQDLLSVAVQSGVVLLRDRVRNVLRQDGCWQISTDASSYRAPTVVDAAGRRACIARKLGVRQLSDEAQIAVWGTGATLDVPMDRTLIDEGDQGWWYGAMLPNGIPLAAFHCSPSLAAQMVRFPERWRAALARSEVLAGAFPVRCFHDCSLLRTDARGLHLEQFAGQGWFAIGDAAISFDPIASQGFCNAIATAAMAARAIVGGGEQEDYNANLKRIRKRYRQHVTDSYARLTSTEAQVS